jgi:lipid II:glycine glycyltransferase (peptidoglycan interpeptide bridge formation enzyme)
VTAPRSPDDWEIFLKDHPNAHLLQTTSWGELKAAFGWRVSRVRKGAIGAQVLFRRLPLGLTLAYIPEGPVGDWCPDLLPSLDALCREARAFALKVEPDVAETPHLTNHLLACGFISSPQGVQPRRTLIVDLSGSEEEVLSRMHQKTRYNIRLASRKGVEVQSWADAAAFGKMVQETAARDSFGAHVPAYYELAYDLFSQHDACQILVARYEGQPLGALMVFSRGYRSWYLYGASNTQHRNFMPNYLLQWEAMRWARAQGCTHYDLWGVPDENHEVLEAEFTERTGDLWGVYRFKRGFGGRLMRSAGAWDRVYNRSLYWMYQKIINFRDT